MNMTGMGAEANLTNKPVNIAPETTEWVPGFTGITVLVVEDIALNQLWMRSLLEHFGFECDIAGNGKVAIEKLRTRAFDIILMDIQMPEMNGFEATQYIRNNLNSDIPIIALTSDLTLVNLAKCKSAGMNDCITKPVDENFLYRKIARLLNLRESNNLINKMK